MTQLYDTNEEAWTPVEEKRECRLEGAASLEATRQQCKRLKPSDCDVMCKRDVLDDNEFETFGKSVACQLKRLSIRRAASAQLKIQAILTEERIEQEVEQQAINVA
jgi:hypothetical protein